MKKTFKIFAWCFGIIASIILCGYGLKLILNLPKVSDLPETILFNENQLNTALETVKILLPMCSGYILAIAPLIKYLKTEKILWHNSVIKGIILTFSFGIIAVGLWSGVFAYLGDAGRAINTSLTDYSYQNYSWNRAIRIASLAHLSFFCSVSWFITTAILSILVETDAEENKN